MSKSVLLISGSANDKPFLEPGIKLLDDWGVPNEYVVASAHRTPEKVQKIVSEAKSKGVGVIIAAAGLAAHLAGVCAAHTPLPIVALPLAPESGTLGGLDSLLAMAQMPSGVPVATVGINQGKNAAILAVQILATGDDHLAQIMIEHKDKLAGRIPA